MYSEVQRSKLFLVLVSTIIFGFGSSGTHDKIFVRSKTSFVFGNGAETKTEMEVGNK